MKKSFVSIIMLLAIGVQALAQSNAVKKIIEMGTTDNQVMRHLDILTNRFGGRLVGSDAYENAAEWMQHEYKKWGVRLIRRFDCA